jgi:hypothetical protein
MYFRCHFAKCEAKFDANPLLPHTTPVATIMKQHYHDVTKMHPKKKKKKKKHTHTHTHTHIHPQNAAWKTASQSVQFAICSGTQLYSKWFLHGIPISGTSG